MLYLLLGVFAGALSGLIGIGGGVIITPRVSASQTLLTRSF